MSHFLVVDSCTCNEPPLPHGTRPPSHALIVSLGGRSVVLDSIGPDIEWELEAIGSERMFEGEPDGVWVWTGRMHGWTSYEGEHDAELRGETRAVTAEEWAAFVGNEGGPWEDVFDDYYGPRPPCPVHGGPR